MENKAVQDMFCSFNQKYFEGKLRKVKLNWSKNMTLCAGKTYCKMKGSNIICSIYLSEPLLSQRPKEDTVNTLLHEMIHAYLFVTEGANCKMGHGPKFREHMNRINKLHGAKITVSHNFREEVDKFRVHVYRCDGVCVRKKPYFGVLRRAISRPPGPIDRWWARHKEDCGGTFHKIEGPDIPKTTHPPEGESSSSLTPIPSPRVIPSAPPVRTKNSSMDSPSNTIIGADNLNHVRKKLEFSPARNGQDSEFGEDQMIRKIKERHVNTSRSKLLSDEETRMKWESITPKCVKLVQGRMNYNYKMKSNLRFDIWKYLEKYRAAENGVGKTPQRHKPEAHTSRTGTRLPQALPNSPSSKGQRTGSLLATAPSAIFCWNCGVNAMVPEGDEHTQKEEKVCNPPVTPQVVKTVSRDMSAFLVPCPSCGDKMPPKDISSHLNTCLPAFTDDF